MKTDSNPRHESMNTRHPLLVGSGLAALLAALFTGCASVESDWGKARSANTVPAYRAFASQHPDSTHAAEARKQIEILEWDTVSKSSRKSDFQQFLARYPSGEFAGQARNRIVELEWEATSREGTRKAYQQFQKEHGNSPFAAKAKEALQRLDEQAETQAYEEAAKTRGYVDLSAYLQAYPNGRHRAEIQKALDEFAWSKLAAPRLLTWSELGRKLMSAGELAAEAKKGFGGLTIYTQVTGSHIARLDDVLFVAAGTTIPGGNTLKPCTFQIDGGNRHVLYFSTPGAGDLMHNLFPSVLIPVGSSFSLGTSTTDSKERSGTLQGPGVTGRSYTVSSGGPMPQGVNLFGSICRSGSVRVVADGLELQTGTELLDRATR